jgi:hypothetical protein
MLQMSEAEKSTTANWSGAIADAFFADSTMTSLKSADEIRTGWSSLTPEQQAQVEQDCNTIETASAPAAPATDGGSATGTSTDTTASTSGTTGTTGTTTGTSGTSSDMTASSSDTSGATTGTAGTSGETTASTSTGAAGSMSDPMTVAQLCDFVGSM